jgi:hypothetical protein
LADHHQLDELRELITARKGRLSKLRASWQGWQGHVDVIRMFADLGDDNAQQQLARWLAIHGPIEELRQRADTGDEHPHRQLAGPPNG